jgi:hypothetical protein
MSKKSAKNRDSNTPFKERQAHIPPHYFDKFAYIRFCLILLLLTPITIYGNTFTSTEDISNTAENAVGIAQNATGDNGTSGTNGTAGEHGTNGTSGEHGANGEAGAHGVDGTSQIGRAHV